MWANGNHYHMEEARVACYKTFDFGIASIFIQGNRFYVKDQSIVIIELNYVGVLEEILVI
jgi:hypothetical protein